MSKDVSNMEKYESTIISIPGKWKTRTEVIQAVASKSDGYLLAGLILMDITTNESFGADILEFEPNQEDMYRLSSNDAISTNDLNEIGNDAMRIILRTTNTTLEGVWSLINAVQGILNAGGLAVKIETTGISYSKDDWFKLIESEDHYKLFSRFVIGVHWEDECTSFGMTSFGLPDVQAVTTDQSLNEINELLTAFNLYQIQENPKFETGSTFSKSDESMRYVVELSEDKRYDVNHIYHNVYGVITLTEHKPKKSLFSIFKR